MIISRTSKIWPKLGTNMVLTSVNLYNLNLEFYVKRTCPKLKMSQPYLCTPRVYSGPGPTFDLMRLFFYSEKVRTVLTTSPCNPLGGVRFLIQISSRFKTDILLEPINTSLKMNDMSSWNCLSLLLSSSFHRSC